MKLSNLLLIAAIVGEATASWGFGKNAYNKWHESELERWLSDHNIPYPKPADRKDLEKLVQENWQAQVVDPYKSWDTAQLQGYLTGIGRDLDKKQKSNKEWLVQQVKSGWHETEKSAETAFESIKDWVFDSWSETQLKNFVDRHGIPNPTPRNRDTLLEQAKNNYQAVADKLGETAAYPGDWLYESWSDSELKKWLHKNGYPVPHPTSRDKLIAAVRRNSRLASIKAAKERDSAKQKVSDAVFDSWSDSKLKEFLDKNNINVPQGSTRNELLALARRNKAYLSGDTIYSSLSSASSAATSAISDKSTQATNAASYYGQAAFDNLIEQWSNTRLKAYLDSRGVPVPQASKRDKLLAKVRLYKHKAATGYGAWTFDTWTKENLRSWLEAHGQKVSSDAAASRNQLYSAAVQYYSSVAAAAGSVAPSAYDTTDSGASAGSKVTDAASRAASRASDAAGSAVSRASDAAGSAASRATDSATSGADAVTEASKEVYASLTSALAQATAAAKDATFETWSDSDLKQYLDTYGINVYQGSTRNELIAMARRNAHYFRYGSQDQGVWGKLQAAMGNLQGKVAALLGVGAKTAQRMGDRAYETAQSVADAVKEKATQVYDQSREEL